jgi:predicted ribosomally synthesized peptide with nif11-like leader
MSRLDLERFTTDYERDLALAEGFAAFGDDPAGWARLAREKGYEITLEEARGLLQGRRELSDDELDEVAGGWDGDTSGGTGGTGGGTGDGTGGSGGGTSGGG